MAARKHIWTDEDDAFAAAQWASDITLREIGAYFGYVNGSRINVRIRAFLEKYGGLPPMPAYWDDHTQPTGDSRKALVKQALAVFVAQRNLKHAEREYEMLMLEGRYMGFLD